ncbi:hypothetical protein Goshw_012613 [Gossypium schwendimanii]|uniref:Uncharacterized protein n=1 Tax=Gossypium schwendimanii TaxID=34291 RepID=A0A7J9M3B2_GOSSC|nr:hypothetical protein [Gossypium schwendimanii]
MMLILGSVAGLVYSRCD